MILKKTCSQIFHLLQEFFWKSRKRLSAIQQEKEYVSETDFELSNASITRK